MNPLKPKHQRLVLALIALAALVGAGLLAAWGLRNWASVFLYPNELVAAQPAPDRSIRLGGMVEPGSLRTLEDGITVAFIVGDGAARVPVRYAGILPDLFVEGSGVIAQGRLGEDGTFVAEELLAKHDENYVPRELEQLEAQKGKRTLQETAAQ